MSKPELNHIKYFTHVGTNLRTKKHLQKHSNYCFYLTYIPHTDTNMHFAYKPIMPFHG